VSEPGYVRRFRAWALSQGVDWETTRFGRGTGGESVAHRLSPAGGRPEARLVAVHGGGNDALFAWVGLFKPLLLRGVEIFTFDLDGHGQASTTLFTGPESAGCVRDAIGAATSARPELPLHLIGVSLGGALLLHELPRLAAASAALVAAPLRVRFGLRQALAELRPGVLRTLWRERDHYGLTGLIPAVGPLRRNLYPLRLAAPAEGTFGYVRVWDDTLQRLDLEHAARSVSTPTLLIYGGRDHIVPSEQGERLATLIPDASLQLLPRETHLTTPLHPRATAALLDWVDRHTHPSTTGARRRAGGDS
jgi:pimeloyl-ACP methyl ester carboxylesterase